MVVMLGAGPVCAEVLMGHVVGVTDGETITVLDGKKHQHKLRVAGIDAPETKQPFGQVSKDNLLRLVFNKEVDVFWDKRDHSRRIVGKVMVASPNCSGKCRKTLDAGLSQVGAGLAWWHRKYSKEQSIDDRPIYEQAELGARSRRQGLWSDKAPIAPWAWRNGDHGQ
jgi:endonuclease YncB( thermonuclease family)